jgi:hypothetical protein
MASWKPAQENPRQLEFSRGALTFEKIPAHATARFGALEVDFMAYFRMFGFLICAGIGLLLMPQASATNSSTLLSNGVQLTQTTTAGTIQYSFLAPALGSKNTLGSLLITTDLSGLPRGTFTLTPAITAVKGVLTCTAVSLLSSGGNTIYITYYTGTQTVHVQVKPSFDGLFASAAISSDLPAVSYLDFGSWPSALGGKPLTVPYDSLAPIYFPSQETFASAYFDWSQSGATWLTATRATYGGNTAGNFNPLRETLKVAVSPSFDDVLPLINNPVSPSLAQVSGRTVVDIWGGSFGSIASTLTRLGNYGLSHCVALVHTWQRYGYDDALPSTYPANPALGGSSEMQDVSTAAAADSCLFGLHENYVDYYPDYSKFTKSAIALQANGTSLLGWMNHSTGIQAYATKPTLYATNASGYAPEIHSSYLTTASFIDGNSSAYPWWRPDMDATVSGSATLASFWNNSSKLWQYERTTHAGPVFGEGRYHWFYSGLLDGVEAQFGAEPTAITIGTKAPLFVDFDLFRIHPLQVNHGMGYSGRWLASGETITSTIAQDAYRMQELIYGHAPYINDYWQSPWHVLQEQNLVSPIAQRYGTQKATSVQYDVNGAWSSTNAAILADDFSRAQVTYANGDSIVANSQSSNLVWNGLTLPQFGWAAKGTGMLAYSALVGGVIADYAQTPTSIFANARNQADLLAEPYSAIVKVASFQQTAKGTAQFKLQWNVINGPLPSSDLEFIHLVNYSDTTNVEGIVASSVQTPTTPTNLWTDGLVLVDAPLTVKLSASLPDGSYSVRVGLAPPTGARIALYGNNDGRGRYTVGDLAVSGHGVTMTFTPSSSTPAIASPDLRLNSAGSVVNFGTVRTDGMVSAQKDISNPSSPKWVLRAYPPYRNVVVQINSSTIPEPSSITCSDGQVLTPTSTGSDFWQVNLLGKLSCKWGN